MAALHIVFMILKITGILLLVLLGLLLAILLALLFCPVRYQARGYRDRERYGGKAGVSWLFHLLAFSAWYDSSEENAGYEIRVLGIPLLKFLKAVREKKKKQRKKSRNRKRALPSQKEHSTQEVPKKRTGSVEREELPEEEQKNPENAEETGTERERREIPVREERKKEPAFLKKIREIFRIPGKIGRALKNFRLTAGDICDKIKKIKEFLESEKFKRGMRLILEEGKKLLAHGFPRKIQGRIKFGTEDPCLTGEILGAAGIFYPLYGENFSIEPCFDQTVLEGTVFLKGRMYGVMVLISAVKLFRSRDVRWMIRHFRQ